MMLCILTCGLLLTSQPFISLHIRACGYIPLLVSSISFGKELVGIRRSTHSLFWWLEPFVDIRCSSDSIKILYLPWIVGVSETFDDWDASPQSTYIAVILTASSVQLVVLGVRFFLRCTLLHCRRPQKL